MSIYLKVKINTLAEEARVIRTIQNRLERRHKYPDVSNLIYMKGKVDNPWTHIDIKKTPNLYWIEGKTLPEEIRQQLREERLQKKLHRAKIASIKMRDPWQSLDHHRKWVVRREARASLLAYGFLRGKEYGIMEHITNDIIQQDVWDRIENIAKRFSREKDDRIFDQKFEEWKQNGKRWNKSYSKSTQASLKVAGSETRVSS